MCFAVKVLLKSILFLPQSKKKKWRGVLLSSNTILKDNFTLSSTRIQVCVYINKACQIIILWYIYNAPELYVWFYF